MIFIPRKKKKELEKSGSSSFRQIIFFLNNITQLLQLNNNSSKGSIITFHFSKSVVSYMYYILLKFRSTNCIHDIISSWPFLHAHARATLLLSAKMFRYKDMS